MENGAKLITTLAGALSDDHCSCTHVMQIENFIFMQTMEYFGCDARDSELSLLLIFSASRVTDAVHPGSAVMLGGGE